MAGIGQTATNASAAAGSQSAANIGNLITGQGNAAAGARMAQGSTWANTGNQLAAIYQRYQGSTQANPYANYTGDYNSLEWKP
mgnify:FL=1